MIDFQSIRHEINALSPREIAIRMTEDLTVSSLIKAQAASYHPHVLKKDYCSRTEKEKLDAAIAIFDANEDMP